MAAVIARGSATDHTAEARPNGIAMAGEIMPEEAHGQNAQVVPPYFAQHQIIPPRW